MPTTKTLLAIGSHLDDCFIGVGGVLIQAVKAGHRVVIVTVVSDYSTRPATRGQEKETVAELMEISERYGFEHRLLGYPYHQVLASDLELKKKLAAITLEVNPDVGFMHHGEDVWPDHRACAELSSDALLFAHGLTDNLTARLTPLVYAYDVTPIQTYHFDADSYYDVTDVMPEFMELILEVDACAWRVKPADLVKARLKFEEEDADELRLSNHGISRMADCLRFGDRAMCRFALGFRTVWGSKRGPELW